MKSLFIISGASRGLGESLAKQCCDNEDHVLGIARSSIKFGTFMKCDFNEPHSIAEKLKTSLKEIDFSDFHKILLINNAAMLEPVGTTFNVSEAQQNITVNLTSQIILSQAFIDLTKNFEGEKLIVNISSGAAQRAIHGWSLYCTTKAGLEHFGRCIAHEQAHEKHPVDVVNISPGVIDTEMQATVRNQSEDKFPAVETFRKLHEDGELKSPQETASQLLKSINQISKFNGETIRL